MRSPDRPSGTGNLWWNVAGRRCNLQRVVRSSGEMICAVRRDPFLVMSFLRFFIKSQSCSARTRWLAHTLSIGRSALLLPSAHSIRCPLIEIARSHYCLDPSEAHIVPHSIAHACKSNGDTSAL